MKTLLLFIWKHSFFFMFLLLEGVAALLIVSNNNYQQSSFINASNGFTASILSASNSLTHYVDLVGVNENLAQENARLHNLLDLARIQNNDSIYKHDDSLHKKHYYYQEAEIISNSFLKRNNYLYLNKGTLFNISPSMGVITSDGIIGIVKDVSENFCTVISVLHSKTAIDVKIKRNGYTGTLVWQGHDYLYGTVHNIPSHVIINLGDTITTSGNSSIFPDNIMIGTISDFQLDDGASFYDIKLKFLVNYNQVKFVYIVDNTLKDELNNLKKMNEDE